LKAALRPCSKPSTFDGGPGRCQIGRPKGLPQRRRRERIRESGSTRRIGGTRARVGASAGWRPIDIGFEHDEVYEVGSLASVLAPRPQLTGLGSGSSAVGSTPSSSADILISAAARPSKIVRRSRLYCCSGVRREAKAPRHRVYCSDGRDRGLNCPAVKANSDVRRAPICLMIRPTVVRMPWVDIPLENF
jgi:hypothetical protein